MFTTRPEITGTYGVVSTTHWLASAVAMGVLEKGGNAFDAAIAAGFTIQVAEPHLNGPGGEFPAILHSARDGRIRVMCAQGVAPEKATIAHFRELGLSTVPGSGLLSAMVPGAFGGWMTLLRDYGTISVRDALSPAIYYAETGVPVLPKIATFIGRVQKLFTEEWTASGAVYLDNGKVPEVGSFLSNPAIAATYRRIIHEAEAAGAGRETQIETAKSAWYQGFIAEAIDRFYTHEPVLDSSGRYHKGLLRGGDMAAWDATYEEPATLNYRNYTVCKTDFWGQGPVMLQTLAMLEPLGLSNLPADGTDYVHLVVEAMKLAFADREAWYGDPNFVDVPRETLLSAAYATARRELIGETASPDLRPGAPDGRTPNIDAALAADGDPGEIGHYFSLGEPTVQPTGEARGDTVHIDVIDRHGNMIAVTPSGGWLQSAPVIPELGFCLNTRGQMFWLDENSPSSLQPKKRPRTTLSPSFALKDGKPYLAWGTPGGDQQDQWQTLLFLNHVEKGMNLQEAIDHPAFHTEHFPLSFWPRGRQPGRLVVENRYPEATLAELKRRGHDVVRGDDWSEGRLCAASKSGDVLRAAANPRGMQGYAAGR